MSLPSSHAINLAWLLRLRWAAIAAQTLTVAIVHGAMHVPLPLGPLALLIGAAAATNFACAAWARRANAVREAHVGAIMVADVVLLTGLLFFTGGPENPFSFLYLVQIALATVIHGARWTWALVALSLAGSALLFVLPHHALALPARTHDQHMRWHLFGMWVALGVAAIFIGYFLARVRRALAARDAELEAARALAARQERLASLATLAGGAAHELATPLSTIATIARELERRLGDSADAAVRDDLTLLRGQVARCRGILDQLSARTGESAGETEDTVTLAALCAAATADLPAEPRVTLTLADRDADARVQAPPGAAAQALRVLLANAQDATPSGAAVTLSVALDDSGARLEVRDLGAGMAPEILARVGEPFFTTKPPGRGMGLGVFLARAVAERVGGSLVVHSTPGDGTRAVLALRRAPATTRRIAAAPGEAAQ